ncbi:hypothetical protein [Streptomyces halobius]|uniref:Uncharacterized protein n=1 Tax=Streptomyces halobius TaxID=2879846 RepID=A0ABY4MLW6_9ACTN|nr:hypothetical protein [Streptomyces halobius]UQA97321.1 hypothetical protein K9S39_40560 [Streptomyces halobius]
MARAVRKRTVFFFEIVEAKDGQPRMDPQPWRSFLDRIAALEPHKRTITSGDDQLVGVVDPAMPEDHLLLAKITGEVPHQLDHGNGTIEALRLAAGTDVAHVTTICFLPYGNIIGALHGGFSAPRVSAIAKWLNQVGLPCGEISLKPVIHARAREKLNRIEAVSELTVSLEGAPADSVSALNANSELGASLRSFGQRHPDTAITLSLKVPQRGRGLNLFRRNRAATQLRSDVLQFIPDLDEWMDESGVVRSVSGRVAVRDPHRQSLEYEPLDFLAHRITAQCDVPVQFTDGRSVDLTFAVNAVFEAARTHEEALQEACQRRPLA